MEIVPSDVISHDIFNNMYAEGDLKSIWNMMCTGTKMYEIGYHFLCSKCDVYWKKTITKEALNKSKFLHIREDDTFVFGTEYDNRFTKNYCKIGFSVHIGHESYYYMSKNGEWNWKYENKSINDGDVAKFMALKMIQGIVTENPEDDDDDRNKTVTFIMNNDTLSTEWLGNIIDTDYKEKGYLRMVNTITEILTNLINIHTQLKDLYKK